MQDQSALGMALALQYTPKGGKRREKDGTLPLTSFPYPVSWNLFEEGETGGRGDDRG